MESITQTCQSERLLIEPLSKKDARFIFDLVNTEAWLRFIGNRNVNSLEDASNYITKIQSNPNVTYWTVSLKEDKTKIGIITYIKRDYLETPDIGFAFLPAYSNMGYAYEASQAVIKNMINDYTQLEAVTIPENHSSIKLLKKLGFYFEKEIVIDNTLLHIYKIDNEKKLINILIKTFYNVFTRTNNKQPNTELLRQICIPEGIIISKSGEVHHTYNIETFITSRQKILTDGTLTQFEEHETFETTTINKNISQRYSHYEKSGILEGKYFEQKGNKLFQFIKTFTGWKISTVLWEDEKRQE
ncbi:MAG: GNAT family N-acetyltransferase [Bacteroidetes bacterium]|nr:GNAT family N-acetyltransferase [Bacteroidota bacterium]